jgi:hypothetical protein
MTFTTAGGLNSELNGASAASARRTFLMRERCDDDDIVSLLISASDQGDMLAARLSPEPCETLNRPPPGAAASMTGKRALKTTRNWPLSGRRAVYEWVLAACGPYNVRRRRLMNWLGRCIAVAVAGALAALVTLAAEHGRDLALQRDPGPSINQRWRDSACPGEPGRAPAITIQRVTTPPFEFNTGRWPTPLNETLGVARDELSLGRRRQRGRFSLWCGRARF